MTIADPKTLIERLISNPQDQEALSIAHQKGTLDPRGYADLLEQVGIGSPDLMHASHWLTQAGDVFSMALGDESNATRAWGLALERDPANVKALESLIRAYREKAQIENVLELLEGVVAALERGLSSRPSVRAHLAATLEQLATLWSDPSIARPDRALVHWVRVCELDRENAFAAYSARELLKNEGRFAEALPYFAMEQALSQHDPERRSALYRDEADVRRKLGDFVGASSALRSSRVIRPTDPELLQELGMLYLERAALTGSDQDLVASERDDGARVFVSLAESYDGEYALGYALSALQISPGDDRAMQLADHFAKQLGRTQEIVPHYAAYVRANPHGFMANEARLRSSLPPAMPAPRKSSPLGPPARRLSDPALVSLAAEPKAQPSQAALSHSPSIPQPTGEKAVAQASSAPEAKPEQLAQIPEVALRDALDKGRRATISEDDEAALTNYKKALDLDPAHPEALSWVEDHLRKTRNMSELRDVLMAASRASNVALETRKAQLRDSALISEVELGDDRSAIAAWKQICQIDRADREARSRLRGLLEKNERWDDVVVGLEQDLIAATDPKERAERLSAIASILEHKSRSPKRAAEAWVKMIDLEPGEVRPVENAVRLLVEAEDRAAAVALLSANVDALKEEHRGPLRRMLGELLEQMGDQKNAARAFELAGNELRDDSLYERAAACFRAAGLMAEAARVLNASVERLEPSEGSKRLVLAAELFRDASDLDEALGCIKRAVLLEPNDRGLVGLAEADFRKLDRLSDLASWLVEVAGNASVAEVRREHRRAAAKLWNELGEEARSKEAWRLVLSDGDDAEGLLLLAEAAEQASDYAEAARLLARLRMVTEDKAKSLELLQKEFDLEARAGNVERTLELCEEWTKCDPQSSEPFARIAAIEKSRGNWANAAKALEMQLGLLEGEEKSELAKKAASLYEQELSDRPKAIRVLEIAFAADPEDYDTIARLGKLCEAEGLYERAAELIAAELEVEGDEHEAAQIALRLSAILDEKLGRSDEALACLEAAADSGSTECQTAYVRLSDRLGWKGIAATKLLAWSDGAKGAERERALHWAFTRFLSVGREADGLRVAVELARTQAADASFAKELESLSVNQRNLDALLLAHTILLRDLSGLDKAEELVRQAEVQSNIGADALEAVQHGEMGLTAIAPKEAAPLLARLEVIAGAPGHVIDLYERQVGRCKVPSDRLLALSYAARVASRLHAEERAQNFVELALAVGASEETLSVLEAAAEAANAEAQDTRFSSMLAATLAASGHGFKDGGKTRAALLRRAARISEHTLKDVELAWKWLGEALSVHLDDATFEALEALAGITESPMRVEKVLTEVLSQSNDAIAIRRLLSRRAEVRRILLDDKRGAAEDLRRLYDTSPGDPEITGKLHALYAELRDKRGTVALYEDQILRGRDADVRAEFARKVARIWEEELGDAREAADAWRRVLRIKPGDVEATSGLARAKTGQLRSSSPTEVGMVDASTTESTRTTFADTQDVIDDSESRQDAIAVDLEDLEVLTEPASQDTATLIDEESEAEFAALEFEKALDQALGNLPTGGDEPSHAPESERPANGTAPRSGALFEERTNGGSKLPPPSRPIPPVISASASGASAPSTLQETTPLDEIEIDDGDLIDESDA